MDEILSMLKKHIQTELSLIDSIFKDSLFIDKMRIMSKNYRIIRRLPKNLRGKST